MPKKGIFLTESQIYELIKALKEREHQAWRDGSRNYSDRLGELVKDIQKQVEY